MCSCPYIPTCVMCAFVRRLRFLAMRCPCPRPWLIRPSPSLPGWHTPTQVHVDAVQAFLEAPVDAKLVRTLPKRTLANGAFTM